MRPLYSLLILLAVVGVVTFAWMSMGDVQPADPAAAPAGAVSPGPVEAGPGDLVAVEAPEGDPQRNAAPVLPVAEGPGGTPDAGPAVDRAQRVRGRVLDPAGHPVRGARVMAAEGDLPLGSMALDEIQRDLPWSGLEEVTTDGDGRFELRRTEPGRISLAVRSAGFAPWNRSDLLVPAGGDHELEPILMERSVIVSGSVLDPDGVPIAGAELLRIPSAGSTVLFGGTAQGALVATSAADGSFTVDQLAAGSFRLRVTHPEHPDQLASGRTDQPGERLGDFDVVMDRGETISGRIEGAPAERLPELLVRAAPELGNVALAMQEGELPPENRVVAPGPDGRFVLRGVRPGLSYTLVVRRPSRRAGLVGLLGTSLSPPVVARAGEAAVELQYRPAGSLTFQVVDAVTGDPVEAFTASAGVRLLMPLVGDDGRQLHAHPNGEARFDNLRPADGEGVRLKIAAVGYREQLLEDLRVVVGQETALGVIRLEPVPLLELTVLDAASGSPVPGATVTLREYEPPSAVPGEMRIEISATDDGEGFTFEDDSARTATTDASGVARLSSLQGLTSQYTIRHRDFATLVSEPFTSPTGAPDVRTAHLSAGGSVVVVMTTQAGEPLAGARVEHRPPDATTSGFFTGMQGPGGVTDADGRVTFEHLAAGAHRFRPAGSDDTMGFMGPGGGAVRMRRSVSGVDLPEDDGWRDVLVTEGGVVELALIAPVRVSLTGSVFEGGRPLEGAEVALIPAGAAGADPLLAMLGGGGPRGRTDSRGGYRIDNVEAGEYTLEISHPTRSMPASFALDVGDEDLVRDWELQVAVLRGRVTDAAGEPLAGVRVVPELASAGSQPRAMRISVMAFSDQEGGGEVVTVGDGGASEAQVRTDEDGRYELRGVRPDVDLVVRGEGQSVQPGQSEVVKVGPDQTRSGVDLTLTAAGRLEVEAFQADGKPGTNLVVLGVFEGEGEAERKSAFIQQGGRTTLEGLAAGPWRITLRSIGELGGGPDAAQAIPDQLVDVVVGETVTATFSVP